MPDNPDPATVEAVARAMEDARMVYFDIPADPCAERMELFRAYARAAIAAHLSADYGGRVGAENVCVTSGATEALGAAILATMVDLSRIPQVTSAVDRLRSVGARLLGVIVNGGYEPASRRKQGEYPAYRNGNDAGSRISSM